MCETHGAPIRATSKFGTGIEVSVSYHWQDGKTMQSSSSLLILFLYLARCSVILYNETYCNSDENTITYIRPGERVNLTCFVDNVDGGLNVLVWSILSFGVSITHVNGADAVDVDQPDFRSIVNDFNDTAATTNATLSFFALTDLDEGVVSCQGISSVMSSCTLYIISEDYLAVVCFLKSFVVSFDLAAFICECFFFMERKGW